MILIFICLSTVISSAQEVQDDKTLSPYFAVMSDSLGLDKLPLKNTSADVKIVGVIADVTITQVYKNEGKTRIEAVYTFPASSNAAVYSMEMTIGNRTIVAEIREKEKARKEYEEAKQEGKRASLLEQERPNVFQMNVANIMPGDEIKVCMKYTELLIPESGVYKFIYPTVVGPRYSNKNAADAAPQDKFVASPYQKEGQAPHYKFDIKVFLSAGMAIQNVVSKSHKVDISYPQTNNAQINLNPSESNAGNKDFILEYSLAGNEIGTGLLLYEDKDEKFFVMMVQPPKNLKVEEIPPREYIFIMDVSGSMQGYPIDISKKLIRNLVVNLRPTDLFNVLLFAGSSGWVSETSMNATAQNVDKAMAMIDQQKGGGGTELLAALQKAYSLPRLSESLSRSFVIMTDGYVDVEKEAFDLIRNNSDQANTFAFGIGESVNRYIIEGMAHVGMGMPMVVTSQAFADEQAEKFRKYISNPVLTQVKKQFANFDVYDVEPLSIPDVLAERPIVIFGKYRGLAKGSITIKGYTGKKRYSSSFDVSTVKPNEKNSAIRYLWARERIRLLDDYNQLAVDDQRVAEVTGLGLKYNLLTAYTSFIAVDKQIIVDATGKMQTVNQVLPLPSGVSNSAIGVEVDGIVLQDAANFGSYEETTQVSMNYGDTVILDTNIYFSKEIILYEQKTRFYSTTIVSNIEQKILATLNPCLFASNTMPDSIMVKVGTNGKIIDVVFDGKKAEKITEECILEAIKKWDFNHLGLNKEWLFYIKF